MRLSTWRRRGDLVIRTETDAIEGRFVPVSTDPPCREPRRQQDGQPRIKVPGLVDRAWQAALRRIDFA